MRVSSYLELATTMIGWHIAGAIAALLVANGLIFLPFVITLIRNWAEPARSQEARSAAPVSLRRMEQDVILFAAIIIFFFLPAVPVTPDEVSFRNENLDQTVAAADPDAAYIGDLNALGGFKVPVAWWLVAEVSAAVTEAIVGAVDSLGHPAVLRSELLKASRMRITDEELVSEIRTFRKDCYEPSLAKFQRQGSQIPMTGRSQLHRAVDWIGSRIFLETPGYYKQCGNVKNCGTGYRATSSRRQWTAHTGSMGSTPGFPSCDDWWINGRIGLRTKIVAALKQQVPSLHKSIESIRNVQAKKRKDGIHLNIEDYEDRYIRRAINLSPWVMVDRADRKPQHYRGSLDFFTSFDGWQQLIGSLGSLSVSAILHVIMELVVIGLPMLQAFLLMLVYVSIPIVVPYSVLKPGMLLRLIFITFSLRFLTALWSLAEFLDEKLLSQLYPDAGLFEFGGGGSTSDIVLNMITLTAYLTLPVAWFYIIGAIGASVAAHAATGVSYFTNNLQSTSSNATAAVTGKIGKRSS